MARAGSASTSAETPEPGLPGGAFERGWNYAVRKPRMEKSMIATTMLTRFSNGRHAPQAAAPSPSCPIAELWGSGGMTAQPLTDQSSPSSIVTGRMISRWDGARSARGRRTLPVTPSRASTSIPRRRSRVV